MKTPDKSPEKKTSGEPPRFSNKKNWIKIRDINGKIYIRIYTCIKTTQMALIWKGLALGVSGIWYVGGFDRLPCGGQC